MNISETESDEELVVVRREVREIHPYQVFEPGATMVDHDFRPQVQKIDESNRDSNVIIEDGQGWHPSQGLPVATAHDPLVSPIPEKPNPFFGLGDEALPEDGIESTENSEQGSLPFP